MLIAKIKYFLILIIISTFSFSCREEILPPAVKISTLNEPVKMLSGDTYTFSINAKENFSDVSDFLFNDKQLNIFTSVSNYNSGFVEINLIDNDQNIFYSNIVRENIEGRSYETHGFLSNQIRIKFRNFTGYLVIQITGG